MNESKKDTDGCKDISNICVELIETVPGICQSKESTMTHYCQVIYVLNPKSRIAV